MPCYVRWLLGGEAGLAAGATGGLVGGSAYCESGAVGTEWDYASSLMMRDQLRICRGAGCKFNVTRKSLSFGAFVTADLFVPEGAGDAPLPVVIFLHGMSYQLGYTGAL